MMIATGFKQNRQGRLALNIFVIGLITLMAGPELAQAKWAAKPSLAMGSPPGVTGLWLDHTGRGAVEIVLCSKLKSRKKPARRVKNKTTRKKAISKTDLCGRIVWLAQPFDKKGRPLTDKLNKRASRRNRKICGLKILGRVKRISNRVYDYGWIYDPEKGKYFDVELRLKSNNILQVKGYLGIKMLNKTFLWRRIAKDLQRCT